MPTPDLAQDLLNNRNAKIGVLAAYWGAEDTLYTATGNAWKDLGKVVPDSLSPDFQRELAQLNLGLPRANKVSAVITTSGMIGFTLAEYTAFGAELAAGSGAGAVTYATVPAPTTVASGPTVNGCVLTSGTGFAVNQYVEVTMPDGTKERTYLDTVAGTTVTWKPALSSAPSAGAAVKAIKTIQQVTGTSKIVRGALLLQFLDQFGEKVSIHTPACTPVGNYKPNLISSGFSTLPLQFGGYAKGVTWNGVTESVISNIYHDYPGVT